MIFSSFTFLLVFLPIVVAGLAALGARLASDSLKTHLAAQRDGRERYAATHGEGMRLLDMGGP